MAFGVAGFMLPIATPALAFPFLGGSLFVAGAGSVIYNVNQVSLRQAITPDRMLGRMNATVRFIVWGTMPIGAFVGGVLGSAVGLRPSLWIAAVGGLFAFVPPLVSPVRSLERIPEPMPTAEPNRAG